MIEQKYSVTRTRATWKPRIADDDLPFYRCPECGGVFQLRKIFRSKQNQISEENK